MTILNDLKKNIYSNKIINPGILFAKGIFLKSISRRLIFVLGCQRSGTTLLYMLLSSHPLVLGYNEDELGFDSPSFKVLVDSVKHTRQDKYVCYKIPTKTFELNIFQNKFMHSKILWIIRHPYSVISSMRSLIMPRVGENWLKTFGLIELKRHSKIFPEINEIDLENIDEITLGAYIYKYKIMTLQKYEEKKIIIFPIKFENLIKDIKTTLKPILVQIGLGWHDSILSHHKFHNGKHYIGENIGSSPVDKSRIKPKLNLSLSEMEKIKSICHVHMQKYNYD